MSETAEDASKNKALTISYPQFLRDGSDHDFRQFLHDTLAFSSRLQDIRNRFAGILNLSGAQYTILISIADLQDTDGGIGINRIAQHLHLSGAFVTIEVNRLVAAGLVEKVENPQDRRRVLLTITALGRSELARLAAVQRPVNDTLFGALSEQEFHKLSVIIPMLVDSSNQALRLLEYLAETAGSNTGS